MHKADCNEGGAMKTYRVKGDGPVITYVQVSEEHEDEILLIVTKLDGDDERVREDRISRELFQMCIETGYLIEDHALSEDETAVQKLSA